MTWLVSLFSHSFSFLAYPFLTHRLFDSIFQCLRISRNLLRSIREAQQGQQEANSTGFTSALYAAATALYFLSPPDPNSPYLVWITPIIQAEFPSDVTRLENYILPNLIDPIERKKMLDLCDSIREEDSRIKELKISQPGTDSEGNGGVEDTRDVKWKIGHVFRHRLFGYCAVVRGFDFTCMASEEWIDAMQVNRLRKGRHQPFYHVVRLSFPPPLFPLLSPLPTQLTSAFKTVK